MTSVEVSKTPLTTCMYPLLYLLCFFCYTGIAPLVSNNGMDTSAAVLIGLVFFLRSSRIADALLDVDDKSAAAAITRARRLQARYGHGLSCRNQFFIDFAAATHLNHGSYGAAPRSVVRAAARAMEAIEAWPDDFMRRRALGEVSRAADAAGALYFRAAPGSCVFIENATVGVNAVLRSAAVFAPKGSALLIFDRSFRLWVDCRSLLVF